ncbi:MAG: hypothetical protein NTY07_06100 [Bacteroidia bacterium]|nr:hypothetical protein [Bacteroidia bacterium]
MHLLFIALLTILAGTLLLAKTKKEELGKFFLNISRFFIIVGFILFLVCIAGGICMLAHHVKGGQPGFRHEMMMRHGHPGMRGGFVCPPGMCKGTCGKMDMQKDSLMKCCPKKTAADTCKMSAAKPQLPVKTK